MNSPFKCERRGVVYVPGDVAGQPDDARCDGGSRIHVVPPDGDARPAGDRPYLRLEVGDPRLL